MWKDSSFTKVAGLLLLYFSCRLRLRPGRKIWVQGISMTSIIDNRSVFDGFDLSTFLFMAKGCKLLKSLAKFVK